MSPPPRAAEPRPVRFAMRCADLRMPRPAGAESHAAHLARRERHRCAWSRANSPAHRAERPAPDPGRPVCRAAAWRSDPWLRCRRRRARNGCANRRGAGRSGGRRALRPVVDPRQCRRIGEPACVVSREEKVSRCPRRPQGRTPGRDPGCAGDDTDCAGGRSRRPRVPARRRADVVVRSLRCRQAPRRDRRGRASESNNTIRIGDGISRGRVHHQQEPEEAT
jgi:hypothetical protein